MIYGFEYVGWFSHSNANEFQHFCFSSLISTQTHTHTEIQNSLERCFYLYSDHFELYFL